MKIAIIIGTRPEIIKLAPIIERIPKKKLELVFTSQHFDYDMGLKFIDQLKIREPKHILKISKHKPVTQMSQIMMKLEKIFSKDMPDAMIVQGDTNTVLASSVCSLKLKIPICHVEAGLRSFDWRMPEEHNRIATDHISDLLFPPTQLTKNNLIKENVHGKIFVTGNTVLDSIKKFSKISKKESNFQEMNKDFILLTLHRAENVDNKIVLKNIIKAIKLSKKEIIFPIHPRTKKRLQEFDLWDNLKKVSNISILNAVGYFEMLELMKNCSHILTDSGGIQEEATAKEISKKTFVIRKTTDRPEAVSSEFSELIGTDFRKILYAFKQENPNVPRKRSPFGDGNSAQKIINKISKNL